MILVNKDTLELFEIFSLGKQVIGLLNSRNQGLFFTLDEVLVDFEFVGFL